MYTNHRLFLRCLVAVALLVLALTPRVTAQTVIDLNNRSVRAKNLDDYRHEQGIDKRLTTDSLAYIDHLTRAFNALHTDSLDRAETLFLQALKVRPDAPGNYVVRYNLGRICLARGRYREAISRFDETLRDHPNLAEARYDRAVCYYETGNYTAAQADCEALLAASPDAAHEVQTRFLTAALHTKTRQPDRARRDLERILQLEPDNESASLLLAGALEDLGQPQAALDRLSLFVSAHPESADGLTARAELLCRLARPDAARDDYAAALRLRPTDGTLYAGSAKAALASGDKAAARRDLEQAVRHGVPRGELTPLFRQAAK